MTAPRRERISRAFRLLAACASALSTLIACNALLGTEPADPNDPLAVDGAPGPDVDADAAAPSLVDSPSDASDASALLPVTCGDVSGLLKGAPWPTGGACNTRVSRVRVPALVKPKIRWRYSIAAIPGAPPGDEFMSGPAVGADGSIYAVFAQFGEAGIEYFLVCVRNGSLRFKTPFPSGFEVPTGVPTLAADGTIYASTLQGLTAFEPSGAIRWTYPLSRAGAGSPAVLGDGTVVVAGAQLVAIRPNGTKRWDLPPVGYSFTGSVTVTLSGLLAVGESPAPAALEGSVSIVSPDGQRRKNVVLARAPATTPLVSDANTIVVQSLVGFHAFDEQGAVKAFVTGKAIDKPQSFGVHSPPRVWVAGATVTGLLDFDLTSSGVSQHADLQGTLAAAGDGLLVLLSRSAGKPTVRGLSTLGTGVWDVPLETSSADLRPPALAADGSVVVAQGSVVYVIGD